MEVVPNKIPRMLSNYELHDLLKSYSVEKHKTGRHNQNLQTVTYEVLKYLEGTPCVNQDEQSIVDISVALAPYNVTKAERLQIINLRPTTPVEISLIVEESEERITEEQIDEILEIVKKYSQLPASEDEDVEEEEEEEEA